MEKKNLHEIVTTELLEERQNWLNSLKVEHGLSKLTLQSYERDMRQFLTFMAFYTGEKIDLQAIRQLLYTDIRAFVSKRRLHGIENRSLTRSLSGIRSILS